MVSQRAIQAGRAEILLRIRDQTQQGLENARRRLVSFAQSVSLAGVAITGFGAALTAPFARSAREFARVEQLLGRFDAVLGRLTVRGNVFAAGLAKNLNISANTVRDLVATFQALNQGSGLSGRQALNISTQLAEAALDLKAFDDRIASTEEAARILASGLSGETEPVRRAFGGDVTARALDLELLRLGINKTSAQATEAERKMARFNLIIRQLSAAGVTGQAAREVNTLAARIEQLGDVSRDTFAAIGAAFGPTLATLAGSLVKGLKELGEFALANRALTASFALLAVSVPTVGIALTALGVSAFGVSLGIQAISAAIGIILTPLGVLVKLTASAVTAMANLAKAVVAVSFGVFATAISLAFRSLFLLVGSLAAFVRINVALTRGIIETIRVIRVLSSIVVTLGSLIQEVAIFVAAATRGMAISFFAVIEQVVKLNGLLLSIGVNVGEIVTAVVAMGAKIAAAFVPALITLTLIGFQAIFVVAAFRAIIGVATAIGQSIAASGTAIRQFLSALGETASVGFEALGSVATKVFGNIKNVAADAYKTLREDALTAFTIIEEALRTGDFQSGLQGAFNFLKIQALELKAFMLEQWAEVGPTIVATFTLVFDNLEKRVKAVADFLGRELKRAIDEVNQAVENAKTEARNGFVSIPKKTAETVAAIGTLGLSQDIPRRAGEATAEFFGAGGSPVDINRARSRVEAVDSVTGEAISKLADEIKGNFNNSEEVERARKEADALRVRQAGAASGAVVGGLTDSLSKLARGTGFDLIGRFAGNRFQKAFEAGSFDFKQDNDGASDADAKRAGVGRAIGEEIIANNKTIASGLADLAVAAARGIAPSRFEGSQAALKDIEKSFGSIGGGNLNQTFVGKASKPLKEAVKEQKLTNSILSDTLDFFENNFSFKFN